MFFLQGYTHAKHRLWQMDFTVRAARGRLSEVIGLRTLSYDRFKRRQGMFKNFDDYIDKLLTNSIINAITKDYTAGVNAYIQSLRYKDYPLEFKLLNYKPEQWTPGHILALGKYMSDMLSSSNRDFEYTKARTLFGEEIFNRLYPDNLNNEAPVVSKPGKWNFRNTLIEKAKDDSKSTFSGEIKTKNNSEILASNNWAVNGKKTTSGHPILASDPHLGLNLPCIWFINHLESESYHVYGVTIPGIPGVLIGFNNHIAWGITNAARDVLDWYEITFKTPAKDFYKFENKWLPVEKVIEPIKIKNNTTFFDTVYYTRWGPIVNDNNYEAYDNGKHYAMKWLALEESTELLYIYNTNKATNYKEFANNAIPNFITPSQNFAFASVKGDIAMFVQGRFPIKRPEQGKFIMDGSKNENDWLGYVSQNQKIMQVNPVRNYVSSANQYPVDSTYPYYTYGLHFEKYRNRRINSFLDTVQNTSIEQMKQLQLDNFCLQAAESLPFFIEQLKLDSLSEEEQSVVKILKEWDFYSESNSVAMAYYNIWWNLLIQNLWDELTGY